MATAAFVSSSSTSHLALHPSLTGVSLTGVNLWKVSSIVSSFIFMPFTVQHVGVLCILIFLGDRCSATDYQSVKIIV